MLAPIASGPAPVTFTVRPVCSHVAFQPLLTLCHPVGQVKVSVQSVSVLVPLFVTSIDPTNPFPQSLVSANVTAQVDDAGLPVVKVSGGDDQDCAPAASRATTLTVYRVPGSRLRTVNAVPEVSPSCSLTAPFCR